MALAVLPKTPSHRATLPRHCICNRTAGNGSWTITPRRNACPFFCLRSSRRRRRALVSSARTEDQLWKDHDGKAPAGRVVIKDRIADSMMQQILTRADEYHVIALPNLNGDYLSDAVW